KTEKPASLPGSKPKRPRRTRPRRDTLCAVLVRRRNSSTPLRGNARSGAVGPQGAYDASWGKRQVRPDGCFFCKKWMCHAFALLAIFQHSNWRVADRALADEKGSAVQRPGLPTQTGLRVFRGH